MCIHIQMCVHMAKGIFREELRVQCTSPSRAGHLCVPRALRGSSGDRRRAALRPAEQVCLTVAPSRSLHARSCPAREELSPCPHRRFAWRSQRCRSWHVLARLGKPCQCPAVALSDNLCLNLTIHARVPRYHHDIASLRCHICPSPICLALLV